MEHPVIMISIFILLATVFVSKAQEERPCKIAYRCSTEEDIVWATDGKSCQVFRNECFLKSTNCDRQNKYEPELEKITKCKCQELCSSECPEDDNPVCGYYNDKKQTFANQCEMDNYICKTGEIFSIYSIGPCEGNKPT